MTDPIVFFPSLMTVWLCTSSASAFSVRPSQLDVLLRYVETQEEHHRSRTFQEEYREFLRKHSVEYDERYVWD